MILGSLNLRKQKALHSPIPGEMNDDNEKLSQEANAVARTLEAPGGAEDEVKLATEDPCAGAAKDVSGLPTASPNAAGSNRLPDKMMAILMKEEAPEAIWWLQKGTAFAMQKGKFEEQILDKHFRGNKFKSLVRNLHRWGFKRMTCDTSPAGKTIAFSHRCFRKDNLDLLKLVQIDKDAGAAKKAKAKRQEEAEGPALSSPPSAPPSPRMPGPSPVQLPDQMARTSQEGQFPSLASMVAAEHHHNLTSQGTGSLYQSLSAQMQRGQQQPDQAARALSAPLGGGSQDHAFSLMERLNAAHEGQHVQPPGIQTTLQAEEQQRRNTALLHQLASLPTDGRSRLLQHGLLNPSARAPPSVANQSLFQHNAAQSLLPHAGTEYRSYLSQLTTRAPQHISSVNQSGLNLEQALHLSRGTGQGALQGNINRALLQDDGSTANALTPEELRYLVELQRRRGS